VPVLQHNDPDARPFESDVLYKSDILRDDTRLLGVPKDDEAIGLAVS
jgi:hypothetical protein